MLLATAAGLVLTAGTLFGQVPHLPDGARTSWVVRAPEEVVGYLTFDPSVVRARPPAGVRFITVQDLATGGVGWAKDYLAAHPTQGAWGSSFLEIVRARTFTIDGRAPDWPADGAAALWFARVEATDSATDLGPGRPLLVLGFWMPDSTYVAYMRARGHFADFGEVKLRQDSTGRWRGSLRIPGLIVAAGCTPTGPVSGGAGSAGSQALIPPATSSITDVVRIAFAGHRERDCEEASAWTLSGSHPLAQGVMLPPSTFQWGYELNGGAYGRGPAQQPETAPSVQRALERFDSKATVRVRYGRRTVSGQVTRLTPDSVYVQGFDWPAAVPLARVDTLWERLPGSQHWKRGALLAGVAGAALTSWFAVSFCGYSDSLDRPNCSLAAVGGALVGGVLFGSVGAFIGGLSSPPARWERRFP